MKTIPALFLSLTACSGAAYASEPEKTTSDENAQLVRIENGDDWIRLKSGEIIKGELSGSVKHESNSYKQEIVFDSDDLGDLEIELDDISVLSTSSLFTIRTAKGKIYEGYLSVKDGTLYLETKGKTRSFPVHRVVSIYRGAESESDYWTTELFIGANFSRGNTNEFSLLGDIEAERNTVESRTKLSYGYEVSESNGEKTAQKSTLNGFYDIYMNNRLFFRPIKLEVTSDEFQNLDYLINASMQVGYFVVVNPELEWDVSLGPGLQHTRYNTVEAGDSDHDTSATLSFTSDLEYEITDDIEFSHTYSFSWASDDAGGIRHKNDFGFDIDIVGNLEFTVKAVWEHVSSPKADSEGVVPYKNDYRMNFGLSYEL